MKFPNTKCQRIELLHQFLEYTTRISQEAVTIVEGRRDLLALHKIGYLPSIIVKGGLSNIELVDSLLDYSLIILLTDFDQEGRELFKSLKQEIQLRKGIGEIDNRSRHLLYQFCRANGISAIEDLSKFSI